MMIFKDKKKQDVLEVIEYDHQPICYGFYQKGFYLACLLKQVPEEQTWLMIPLEESEKDREIYARLKDEKISWRDLVASRPGIVTSFNSQGKQTKERKISSVNLNSLSENPY